MCILCIYDLFFRDGISYKLQKKEIFIVYVCLDLRKKLQTLFLFCIGVCLFFYLVTALKIKNFFSLRRKRY